MQNCGIFTQICVLQGFNAKEAKRARKAGKNCSVKKFPNVMTITSLSRQDLKQIQEEMSQKSELHRDKY